jgi:DNA-binding MurR/RpiR family transcriptional regulator
VESALFAIRQYLPEFPAAERRIALRVLEDPRRALQCKVTDLARQSGVSQAAVVRFCRRLGMKGFGEFKLRLSQDVFRIAGEGFLPDLELEAGMDSAQVVKGVIGAVQRNLARLESLCDVHLLYRAAELIAGARSTLLFGIGASGLVAQDFYQKLVRIGFSCAHTLDTDLQITAACGLRSADAALVISYSGESPAMLRCAEWARKNGAALLTLTGESSNPLRSLADIPLLVPSLEPVYRSGATVSRISQMAVVDMLYSLLLCQNLDESLRALERTMTATHGGNGGPPTPPANH